MSKRILAVDDDADMLDLIRNALGHEGYEVETASDGEQCLQKVAANAPDVLILDVKMPGMNGAQVARKLRADTGTAKIPIIMLTALSDKKYMKAALFDLGVEYYLTKPYAMDDLLDKVAMAIRYRIH